MSTSQDLSIITVKQLNIPTIDVTDFARHWDESRQPLGEDFKEDVPLHSAAKNLFYIAIYTVNEAGEPRVYLAPNTPSFFNGLMQSGFTKSFAVPFSGGDKPLDPKHEELFNSFFWQEVLGRAHELEMSRSMILDSIEGGRSVGRNIPEQYTCHI